MNSNKLVFKNLNKLPITKRVKTAQEYPSVLRDLTPTEFAQLFPRYYQHALPDVGGFRLATTKASQAKQAEADASILERITGMEKSGEKYAGEVYEKIKRKLGLGQNPLPSLSPEQAAAFQKLQAGGMAVDSADGKIFANLTEKQLASLGVNKIKDATGHEVFNYTQPQIGREEAISRLATPTGGNLRNIIDQAAKKNGIDARIMYGMVAGESGHGNKYDTNFNSREESWGPFQMNRASWNPGLGTDFERETGKSVKDPSTLQAQADWIAKKIASKGDNARQWVASQWFGYHGDRDWNNSWGTMGAGTGAGGPAAAPEGPNGQYSDQQISKMMDQLRTEKNDARKQQLANLLTNAGVPTATVQGAALDNVQSGGAQGRAYGSGQCVALSRQFSNLGPAAKWNFHEGESGIVPGAVIATRSYGQGATPGGKMAKDMPDKKSHYHTGIALTYPDKDGNVLVYDQWKGHGATISKRNIRDYNGEKWGAVVGGEPSDKSREAVNLALGQASESQKAAIHAAMTGQSTNLGSVEHSSPVKEDAEADSAPSGKQLDQDGNVIQNVTVNGPTTIVQQAPAAAPPQPTAEVKKVEPAVTRFNFNKEAFLNEVGTKHPMAYSFVGPGREGVWSQTVQGLRDAEAKGVVKFNEKTGELVVNDMKHPEVQKILKDMKDNDLDRNTFMKQVEEKKAQAAPTPKAPPETKPASPAAQQTPATVKTEPAKEPPKVPGAATGGSFNVPDGGFRMEPLAINKGDNMAAVSNKTGQPLFTANSNEAMRYDPYNKRVDVSPTHKTDGNMRPSGSNVQDEMDALRNEMRDNLMGSGQPAPPQAIKISQSPPTSSTFTDDLTKSIARNPYNNPAFERAMMRTRMQEHGDPLNNHYSSDNTNW